MKPRRKRRFPSKPNKGIYLLPNLLTAACLFAGFFALICTVREKYESAAMAIIIAALCDGLDGRLARLTNTTSHFGMEFDSLADLVAFGVAPGIFAFKWGLFTYGRLGWLAAFMYVICGALRLARFNVQKQNVDPNYFKGLPIPAAACLIASATLFMDSLQTYPETRALIFIILIYVLSFLMVSTILYPSFKKAELGNQKPFHILVGIILTSLVIAFHPKVMFFFIVLLYVFLGPARALYRFKPAHVLKKVYTFKNRARVQDRAYENMLDLQHSQETDKSDD